MSRFARPIDFHETELHGVIHAYRRIDGPEGSPVVILIHGMAGSGQMWEQVMGLMSNEATIIAPDLLGHGASGRGRSLDYSIGNQAALIRDLMVALEIDSATIVGQSLGGGVAMQFAYQFPQRCDRLVLVDAGGLGKEVTPLLRALSLPGSGVVLAAVTVPPIMSLLKTISVIGSNLGLRLAGEHEQMASSFESLADAATRRSFLATLRAVVDIGGQAVAGRNRLYLTEHMPVMVCWGDRDGIIPNLHASRVSEVIPHARVEIFEGAGHFPQNSQPEAFAEAMLDFIETTEAAALSADDLRTSLAG